MNAKTSSTDWRGLALELAAAAGQLAGVAGSVSKGWRMDPLAGGALNTHAEAVAELVARVARANTEGRK